MNGDAPAGHSADAGEAAGGDHSASTGVGEVAAGQGAPAGDHLTPAGHQAEGVERLFPFVLKGKILVIGRDALRSNKGRLHFVLIATDIIEAHREEVLRDLKHYPVVQHYTAAELERFFGCKGAKAIGFTKSGLAQSIYAGLKAFRLNKPPAGPTPPLSQGLVES